MLRTALAATLVALLPCAAIAAPADAAKSRHHKRPACQRLTGKDRAPAASVKLVKRHNGDNGTDLVGCVLPAGHLHTIASSEHYDTADFSYAIVRVVGRIALVYSSGGNQYAYNTSTVVWNLGTGRSYTIARLCSETGGMDCVMGGSTSASTSFVTSTGRAVAAVIPAPGAQPSATALVTIASFDPSGVRKDLDSGSQADVPAQSLALDGTIASWTHGGVARSADLTTAG
jgi:hypothetical protein